MNELIGAWRLVSFEERTADAEIIYPYGKRPVGLLIYTACGQMSVQVMSGERDQLSSNDLSAAGAEEIKRAVEGFTAFFGTFEIDEKEQTIIHKVEGHILPNSIGKSLKRRFELKGDSLVLMPSENRRVEWRRIKAK